MTRRSGRVRSGHSREVASILRMQRTADSSGPVVLQRQAQSPPTTQPPQTSPTKRKTLRDEGVGLNDPVSKQTAQIIDEVLKRNRKLAPYIGDRLQSGFQIAGKGKFVREVTDSNFDSAYRKAYKLSSSRTVSSDVMGFYDPVASRIHLRPDAKFGTALHEAVHSLAAPSMFSTYLPAAKRISRNLLEVLSEGVTAYFTDVILQEEGLGNWTDAYRSLKRKAEKLVKALGTDGFDLMAKFNFKGSSIVQIGEKLGISQTQYIQYKGKAITEVLKRMARVVR